MSFNSGNKNVNDMIIASKNNRKNAKDFLKWIESSRLKVLHELDRGAFGVVHKVRWYKRNYTDTVAVKFFHDDREFLREFTNIHRMIKRCSSEDDTISEKNLVHYYGATYDYDNEEYGIVMEYYSQSSLSNYLYKKWKKIYWEERLKILRDISYALYILHDQDLVHGDLHSGNIMIDDDKDDPNIAWIGDLGFCREEENEKKYDGFRGVMAFMAPEILKELPYSKKADIYSFGCIMYHVSTNRAPFYERAHNRRLMRQISEGLKPTIYQDDEIPSCFESLMHQCWNFNPKNRPNACTLYNKFCDWIDDDERFEDVKWDTIKPVKKSDYHRETNYMSQTWIF
ncbi:kinase-like protein [Rhizophagus irregularis]|uniref:Kinase-like protein n=1 Tax=Rhizophagus irregularis TaxID=588596 RepID=A0A2I1G871_9GLOM|nr:kinase-like protein [Rhizophagus irregularis]